MQGIPLVIVSSGAHSLFIGGRRESRAFLVVREVSRSPVMLQESNQR